MSQKQLIMDSVAKKLDPELREQVQPLLEAILQAQPTIKIKSYEQTTISITMPKLRYERMGRPQVGEVLEINISRK
jgi:phage-related protein